MNKITAVFALIALVLSLTACDGDRTDYPEADFDIAETWDIDLGNEVASVTVRSACGESITLDNTADFYEIFDNLYFEYTSEMKCSYVAETRLGDNTRTYMNINTYYVDGAELYEYRAKKDGDDAVASIEEYAGVRQLDGGGTERFAFCVYSYKSELALGGYEGGVSYEAEDYPIIPSSGSELADMQVRASFVISLSNSAELLARHEDFVSGGNTYSLEEFVTREYKLYENYIVFKKTSPFLTIDTGGDPYIMYMRMKSSDCSVTEEVYYNIAAGRIEFIRIYGDTDWHLGEYIGQTAELDIRTYVRELDLSEFEEKIQRLTDRVKNDTQ